MKALCVTFLIDYDSKNYTSLSYSLKRAFEKIGCECDIVSFSVNKYLYKIARVFPYLIDGYLDYHQRRIIQLLQRSKNDVVFVVKGYYLKPETINLIKSLGKKIICFHPDDPFSTQIGSSNENTRNCIAEYDAYLIWHKGLIDLIKEKGCPNVLYMPFAADTEIIHPPKGEYKSDKKEQVDVSFIGNSDEKRRRIIREISSNLNIEQDARTAVFGLGWKDTGAFECHQGVFAEEYLSVMHRSKINLNILRKQNEDAHNMRTFEIPAAGGFMLHEYSEEAAGFFEEGKEAEYFRNSKECTDKIIYYLNNDTEREKIAKAGYNRVISSDYTYSGIGRRMLKSLDSLKS